MWWRLCSPLAGSLELMGWTTPKVLPTCLVLKRKPISSRRSVWRTFKISEPFWRHDVFCFFLIYDDFLVVVDEKHKISNYDYLEYVLSNNSQEEWGFKGPIWEIVTSHVDKQGWMTYNKAWALDLRHGWLLASQWRSVRRELLPKLESRLCWILSTMMFHSTWHMRSEFFSRQSAGAYYIYLILLSICASLLLWFLLRGRLNIRLWRCWRLILTRRDRVKLSNSVYFHYSELCFSSIAAQARFAICKRRMGGPFVCHIAWKPMTSRWSSPSSLMHVSMPKPLKITFANLPKKMVRRWSVWAPWILRTFEDFKHLTWHVCQQLSLYQAPAPPVILVA